MDICSAYMLEGTFSDVVGYTLKKDFTSGCAWMVLVNLFSTVSVISSHGCLCDSISKQNQKMISLKTQHKE